MNKRRPVIDIPPPLGVVVGLIILSVTLWSLGRALLLGLG